jgi:hypothetical protein
MHSPIVSLSCMLFYPYNFCQRRKKKVALSN